MSNNPIAISGNQTQTMSSLEIATLCEKNHKDVLRDIRKTLEEAEIDSAQFCAQYKDPTGRALPCFYLPRRECDLVIAGYSVKYRLAIIDRWQELERQAAFKMPTTYVEALRRLADETEAKEAALEKIESQQLKIDQQQNLIKICNEASVKAGEILVREFVKSQDIVDLGERQFFSWMREQKLCFGEHNEPYQQYVTAGYFTYKPTEKTFGGKYRYTLRITPRGKVWLAAKYMAYLDAQNLLEFTDNMQRCGLQALTGGASC